MPLDPEVEAIVNSAVAKAVAETRDQMRGLFDDATDGLKANRDKILNEKRDLEKKIESESEAQRVMRLADNYLASRSSNAVHPSPDHSADGNVIIRKGVSTEEYQRLKKLAADTKSEIVYVDESSDPSSARQQGNGAPTAHDFKFEDTRYVSAHRVHELGGPIKARHELGDYVAFRSLSDLPEGAKAAHDAAGGNNV